MNFYKTILPAVLILYTLLSNVACTEKVTDYDREKIRLDSLKTIIVNTKLALNVDENHLKTRIGLVDLWYIRLKDTTAEVAAKMQVDFNGFKAVYNRYVNNFFVYQSQLLVHEQQYKKLEEKVKEQNITRNAFKKEYEVLRNELITNFENASAISKPVYDLEFSWNRYEKLMEGNN